MGPSQALDHRRLVTTSASTHVDSYLDGLEWRFNNRDNPWLFRDTLLKLLEAKHVRYEELVALTFTQY